MRELEPTDLAANIRSELADLALKWRSSKHFEKEQKKRLYHQTYQTLLDIEGPDMNWIDADGQLPDDEMPQHHKDKLKAALAAGERSPKP